MPSWRGGAEVLDQLPMLVVNRPGSMVNPMARHALKLSVVTPDISSTEVRRRQITGEPINSLVSQSVYAVL